MKSMMLTKMDIENPTTQEVMVFWSAEQAVTLSEKRILAGTICAYFINS